MILVVMKNLCILPSFLPCYYDPGQNCWDTWLFLETFSINLFQSPLPQFKVGFLSTLLRGGGWTKNLGTCVNSKM